MSDLEITFSTSDDATFVNISGEATIYTASLLREQLLQAWDQSPELKLDLSRVREIDTAGLQILLAAQRQAAKSQKRLQATAVSQPVLELLHTLGLENQFQSLPQGE